MFTLAISYLTTSNLPWFMDLTFQVPMQYCSLQNQTLLSPPDIYNWVLSPLWPSLFIIFEAVSSLFPSTILDTYSPGELIFWCHIFLPFLCVHGVLEARILKGFAIPTVIRLYKLNRSLSEWMCELIRHLIDEAKYFNTGFRFHCGY